MKILQDILWILFYIVSALLFIWAASGNWTTPVVHYSTSQDRCLKVLVGEEWEPCSCIDLENDKYIKVMVK